MVERFKLYSYMLVSAFWLTCSAGVIEDIAGLRGSGILNLFALITDVFIFIAGLLLLRKRTDCIVLLSYIFVAGLSTLVVNHNGLFNFVNGSRNFLGLLFTAPIIHYFILNENYKERFISLIDKQLYIFLFVQAVVVPYQFIRYGAGDFVGGSMGFGFSGILSTMIYVISFYLISKRWDYKESYLANLRANIVLIVLLFPTFLNETKVSFIFLPLYFILLYRFTIKDVFKFFIYTPLILAGLVGVFYLYLSATNQDFDELTSSEFYEDYLVGQDADELISLALAIQDEEIETDNVWAVDLPRFTKIFLAPEVLKKENGGIWLGAGTGQFKGGSFVDFTKFSKNNRWVINGTRPYLFSLLIELGILGVIWFIGAMIIQSKYRTNPNRNSFKNKLYISIIILVILFYNDALFFWPICFLFFYVINSVSYGAGQLKEEPETLSIG